MQAWEAHAMLSWLKITRTKRYNQKGERMPRRVWTKSLSPAQLKISIYSKDLLAIYMAFLEFAQFLWDTSKPTIVLTDNKSITRFFQTKAIPPSLWNACDYVLQFNFKIAHIAGSINRAADFLSRIQLKTTVKIHLIHGEGWMYKQHP